MISVEILPAKDEHVDWIATHMRQADRDEVMAATGHTPHQALRLSLEKSDLAWTGFADGVATVMFGAGTLNALNRIGAPWLLGTDGVKTHYRVFLRSSLLWKSHLLSNYDELMNMVDDRNDVSKRWLSWLGFTLEQPVIAGVEQIPFRRFTLKASDDSRISIPLSQNEADKHV